MANGNSVTSVLEAGLKASGLRGRIIANNLANVDTPGYRRRAIRFEKMLADALDAGGDVDLDAIQSEIFRPMDTPLEANGNDVSMDMEVGEMVKNSARYKTYIRVLNKLYGQMEHAMRTD